MVATAWPREEPRLRPARLGTAMTLILLLLATALVAYRTARRLHDPGRYDPSAYGLQDFRDAIYYPVTAFMEGRNPYDASSYRGLYPVGQTFPLYSPLTFLIHWPLALLPLGAAQWVYFLGSVACILIVALLAWRLNGRPAPARAILVAGALLVLSEPGQWGLSLGQSAPFLAAMICAALYYAPRRSWWAAIALALSTLKPTCGAPLAVLMLARGDGPTVLRGAIVGGALTALPVAILTRSAGGIANFLISLRNNYARFSGDANAHPPGSAYRVDTAAVIGRLLGIQPGTGVEIALLVGILVLSWIGLRWLRRGGNEAAERLSASLVCLALLLGSYRPTYELLILVVPLVAATCPLGPALERRPWLGRVLFLASLVPLLNFLVDGGVMNRLGLRGGPVWLAIATINGTAILLGLATVLVLARSARHPERSPVAG